MSDPQSMLDLALATAARGFYVFPVIANGKTPAIKAWQTRATRDPDTIRAWWTEHDPVMGITREKPYNVGIRTGRFGDAGNVVVLDVDVKEGARGRASLDELDMLEGEAGWLDTYTVDTPSGGWHVYYLTGAPAATTASRLGKGLDTRGEGGYVVAPGSVTPKGAYRERGGALRPAPAWLLERIGAPQPRIRAEGNVVSILDTEPALERATRYAAAQAGVEQGARGSTAYRLAARVKDFGVTEQAACEILADHWAERCDPPMPYEDLAVSVANAYAYGREPAGVSNPTADFEPVLEADEDGFGVPVEGPPPVTLEIVRASDFQGRAIPPRLWHAPGLVPAKTVTLIGGDGGTGKSLVGLQLAVATWLGRPWFGRPTIQGPALVLAAEDDLDEIHRRMADIARAEAVTLEQLDGVYIVPMAGKDAVLAAPSSKNGVLRPTPLWAAVRRAVEQIRPRLALLDTLADLYAGSEIDRAQVRQFIGMLRGLSIDFDLATVLLAHPSLSGMASGSGTSGSTGWSNSVRSRLYFRRVLHQDDKGPAYEPDPDVRVLETKKSNYDRTGETMTVRYHEGVFVLDEEATSLTSSTQEAKMQVEALFLSLLRQTATQGRRVVATTGANYAPTVFAEMPSAKGVTKAAFRDAMERLLDAAKIKVAEKRENSKVVKFIEETAENPHLQPDDPATPPHLA